MTLTQDPHQRAQGLITQRLGLDFSHKRERDLERGLRLAVQASSHATLEAYLDWLAGQPEENPEWMRLAGYLTVGETYFFRDRFCFDALEHRVLLPLIEARRESGWRQLRIWSAGCATGEEPYSFAMLLDRLVPDRQEWTLTILATDINPGALHAARLGRYRGWSLRATPAAVRDRYFRPHGSDTFELDRGIREMVTFTPLNLAHEGYPAPMTNTNAMDAIFCRNVLMYFTPEAQRAVAKRLHQALVPEGWLAVSPAEATAELWDPLQPVNFPGTIFFRKTARTSRPQTPTFTWPHASDQAFFPLPNDADPVPVHTRDATSAFAASVIDPSPARHGEDVASVDATHAAAAPSDSAILLRQARALADQGRLEQARTQCRAALGRDKLNVEAYLLLAAIAQELGESGAAQDALRRALYLDPKSPAAHFLLGSQLYRERDYARARRAMETVLELVGPLPRDQVIPACEGLTAGRLIETAQCYLASEAP